MTDIVERLRRSTDPFWHHERPELVSEAADEIERLRAALIKSGVKLYDVQPIDARRDCPWKCKSGDTACLCQRT